MSDQQNQYGPAGERPYGTPDSQPQQGYPTQQGFTSQRPYPSQPAPPNYPPGYQQPYGAPSPYGYQGQYGMPTEHPQGTIILVLGILGIVVGPIGIAAWIMGAKTEKEIAASGIRYSNEGNIKTGKILGIVFTILTGVGVLAAIAYVIFIFAMIGSIAAYTP